MNSKVNRSLNRTVLIIRLDTANPFRDLYPGENNSSEISTVACLTDHEFVKKHDHVRTCQSLEFAGGEREG